MPGGPLAEGVHIGYTLHRFWPAVGGTELALMDLATELRKLGHDITVVTSDEKGSPALETHNGIKIHRFELIRRGKFRLPTREYREFVLKGDWDVTHVKGQRVWSSDYLFRHVPKIRQPKVFTAHGFHQWHMHRRDLVELWYYRWHLPRMLRPIDTIIALTGPEVEELVAWGVEREKIIVLPDGVNLHEYKAPPKTLDFREKYGVTKKHMILYAGGFYDNKRVDRLIQAAARLQGDDVELVVVGKDAHGLRPAAEKLTADLKAPVKFTGVIPREDLVKAFFEADLFWLGSKFEGYGIVLLETLAAGVPFVAFPSGAAPDLASIGAGKLATSPEEMARVTDELLADPALRKKMGDIGKRRAHAQTLEWAAKEHEKVYRALLDGRRPAAPIIPGS